MSRSDRVSIRPLCFGQYERSGRADRGCPTCKSGIDCIPPQEETTMAGDASWMRTRKRLYWLCCGSEDPSKHNSLHCDADPGEDYMRFGTQEQHADFCIFTKPLASGKSAREDFIRTAHSRISINSDDSSWMEIPYQGDPDKETLRNVPVSLSKYHREIKPGVWVDVYDVLHAFAVTNSALQHLIKKALAPGQRGHKDLIQDLDDIVASAIRARELEQ